MIPENSLELLEFNNLLRLISDFANSDASRKSVLDIHPLNNKADIERRLSQIYEIRKMSQEGSPLSLSPFPDISLLLLKIRPDGAILDSRELSDFIPVLSIASEISLLLRERNDVPSLKEVAGHLTGFPDILNILKKSIDSEGNIFDSASYLLSDLRSRIRRLEGRIRKKLEEIVRDERVSILLQDDFITTRSGRWVIPVRMDSKGMIPGVVHDVSKSGETAFIEPIGIINLANELENLIAEQKAEEIRILRSICANIRNAIDGIYAEYETIVYLDVLNCIAKFADLLNMEPPQINESGIINFSRARHPLLQLTLQKQGSTQQVVPLDVQLGGNNNTVMIITGPNAGGKTIAIKTIGLLILMALSGMPIPADSSSSLPLIQNLVVDIGDEQSIEDNLSTFSAHISNISEILKKADSKTIVLIDELGTGTDPEEGAALACAILKEIRKNEALTFATTHLSDIKGFVHITDGMINASMEFDHKTLNPLYRLRVGEPGQSHALEIARRYGLPDNIIESAKVMLGRTKAEFDHMITDMNIKRSQYERALNELKSQQSEVEKKNKQLGQMLSDTEDRKKEILMKAYKEAYDIISDTKRQMYTILEENKKKDKVEKHKVMKQIEAKQESVTEKLREFDTDDTGTPPIEEIKNGDIVYVRSLGYDASVIEVNRKNNRLKLMAGGMEIEVLLSDIGFKKGKSIPPKVFEITVDKEETVSSRINLVGMRVDEAVSRLEHFLNHAALAELSELIIIHGIGKGLLKKAVHEHLDGHPLVKRFRSGNQAEGGNGVTIAILA